MLRESEPAGIEPATRKSQVQHPIAKPPRNRELRGVKMSLSRDSSTTEVNLSLLEFQYRISQSITDVKSI